MAQIRGHKTPNQQVGFSDLEYLKSFLVEFLLFNFGKLIETVAAFLVASVSKITSVREADVRT